jgi:hypothetical protein
MKIYFGTTAINVIIGDPVKPKVDDRLISQHTFLLVPLLILEIDYTALKRDCEVLILAAKMSKISGQNIWH